MNYFERYIPLDSNIYTSTNKYIILMNIDDIKDFYSLIITVQQTKLSNLKKKIFRTGTIRLIIVILCTIGVYVYWSNLSLVTGIILISFIVFLVLMRYHNKLFNAKNYSERLISNAQNELNAINYDFSAFDGAAEKINAEHSFSLDLDLFGDRSFFQSMNRTVTSFGKDVLADTLIHPLKEREAILARQKAIEELKQNTNLLSHFRAIGQSSGTDNLDTKKFSKSFSYSPFFTGNKLWESLIYIFPLLYITGGILTYLDIISGTLFFPLYIATLLISTIPDKKVGLILATFDKKSQILDTYSQLLEIIENAEFKSELLQDIQKQLDCAPKASIAVARLKSLHNKLMMSKAYPIFLLINPLFLWNVKYAVKVEKWISKHSDEIMQWFDAMAKFDAMVSWAIFAFNHPDYTYPNVDDTRFTFSGSGLGHPMLRRDVCVRNDVNITKTPYFLVVTGANMAGKSTYLRTIGINHTLACAGAPVCANSLTFYPGSLVTNLRTADSLADNESYFFAELKRLKMIIDRLKSGEKLFIILDEILKGTNSVDKQKGSLALMKQLISLNGNGIIATHDLVLGNLEKEFPDNIKNYRFEADITDNHLSFTYKINEGIAQNMNASFLMKQMGITGL